MTGVLIGDPWAESPTPGAEWLAMNDALRLALIHGVVSGFPVTVIAAHADGQVIVRLEDGPDAASRGILLRKLERHLKETVDAAIEVYCEPVQDKNALRRLRGVKVAE